MNDELVDTTDVVVGTCDCGGYGVVFDEQAEEKIGRCHIPLDEYTDDTPI